MKIKVTLFSILLLHSLFLSAQIHIDWQQCYGSMKDDEAYSIMRKNGRYYVVGSVENGGDGMVECEFPNDFRTWLIEIGESGEMLGQHCFDFAAGKISEDIYEDNSLYLLGATSVGSSSNSNPGVMKITEDGNVLWHRSFGAEDHNFMDSPRFTQTPDGGFICSVSICFSGGDISHYYGFWDVWVVKLDSLGNIEWETTIGTEEGEFSGKVIANLEGTYLVASHGSPGENGNIFNCKKPYYMSDGVAIKLTSDGAIIDSRCYGGSSNDTFVTVTRLEDGYVFGGATNSVDEDLEGSGWHSGYNHLGTPTSDVWLLRTDYDGNVLWSRCYGGSGDDSGSWVFQNDDGGFTVFGTTQSYDGDVQSGIDLHPYINMSFGQKIWIFRTDAEGNLLWERAIGSATNSRESIQDVIKLSEKEYAIAGTVYCGYPQSGDVNCSNGILFNGQDSWDNFWVLHITDIFNYDDPTGIEEQPKVVPLQMNVHPNPATTWVAIEYTLPNGNAKAELSIFNAMGIKVKQVELDGNQGQKVLDLREFANGVYTITILCGEYYQTEKLVVTK